MPEDRRYNWKPYDDDYERLEEVKVYIDCDVDRDSVSRKSFRPRMVIQKMRKEYYEVWKSWGGESEYKHTEKENNYFDAKHFSRYVNFKNRKRFPSPDYDGHHFWCKSQIYYYFKDNDGGNWLIYLRWSGQRGDEPWSAELDRCDENWEHIPESPDYVNLLEEKNHTPGTVKGYYYDEEYPFLMERVLEIVREMKPELKDQLI